MSGETLSEKEFLQHVTQNLSHMAWFLGAGASRAAGMPSAWDITWDLKKQFHKTLPVTLVYSQVFANVVKQTPDIVNEIYDYRFFM